MQATSTPSATRQADRQRECPECGLFQCVPDMPRNGVATCRRCDAVLRRERPFASMRALALSLSSLIFYLVAISAPFLSVDIVGRLRNTTMLDLPLGLSEQGAWELGVIVAFTAIVAPLCKILVLIYVLLGLRTPEPPSNLPAVFKWYSRIGPWAMVEVFLLGVFVAFTRLGAIATVDTGNALYALGALMMTMVAADSLLDADTVWETMERRGLVPPPPPVPAADRDKRIACRVCARVNHAPEGAHCSRCAAVLHHRKPNSIANTWAFLVASAILYIPANLFPVLIVTRLGAPSGSTIVGGAQELLEAGMWPLALLVFVASLMVPMLKLLSLAIMLCTTHRGSAWRLEDRTRLFRIVEFIGRWSMIDIFMAGTLVALVQAGVIATIEPGLGAICFGSVVVLTMVAAACFDPRLMWDAAGERAPITHQPFQLIPDATDRPASAPAEQRAV